MIKKSRESFLTGNIAIINPRLQLRFVCYNLLLMCSMAILIIGFIHYRLNTNIEVSTIELTLPIAIIAVIHGILAISLNLYLSFKASAPVRRLENYFKDVSSCQEVLPLSFRKDDYYQELPALVVEALMRLEQKKRLEQKTA
jgi:hypothetical protein